MHHAAAVNPFSQEPVVKISAYVPGEDPISVVYFAADLTSEEALQAETRKLLVFNRQRRMRRQRRRRRRSNGGGNR